MTMNLEMELVKDNVIWSKTYRQVLAHRKKCPKWTTGFCLNCFGGGLTQFTRALLEEFEK